MIYSKFRVYISDTELNNLFEMISTPLQLSTDTDVCANHSDRCITNRHKIYSTFKVAKWLVPRLADSVDVLQTQICKSGLYKKCWIALIYPKLNICMSTVELNHVNEHN